MLFLREELTTLDFSAAPGSQEVCGGAESFGRSTAKLVSGNRPKSLLHGPLFAAGHFHAESEHPRFYWSQRTSALVHWIQQFASARPFGMRDANREGRTAGALSQDREISF